MIPRLALVAVLAALVWTAQAPARSDWQFPNGAHSALFHATIELTGGRKHGTFKGTTLDLKPGSGTFSC